MSPIFFLLLVFGSLVYWIFAVAMRDRGGIDLRVYGYLSWGLVAAELIFFGMILGRIPIVRTPVGIVVAIPVMYMTHRYLNRRLSQFLKDRGLINPPKKAEIITIHPAQRAAAEALSRHFYVILIVGYLLLVGLALLAKHVTTH